MEDIITKKDTAVFIDVTGNQVIIPSEQVLEWIIGNVEIRDKSMNEVRKIVERFDYE